MIDEVVYNKVMDWIEPQLPPHSEGIVPTPERSKIIVELEFKACEFFGIPSNQWFEWILMNKVRPGYWPRFIIEMYQNAARV